MKAKLKIVSIGESMVEMSQHASSLWKQGFAGDTLNTAYYLKALLGEAADVHYLTCLGDDLYSSQMLEFIAKNGIDTQYIRQIAGKRPGLYLIHQQDGDRHFTYWRETSAARHLADDEGLLRSALMDADLVYFSGITLAILGEQKRAVLLRAIEQARPKLICFDPNIRRNLWPDTQELQQLLRQVPKICDIVLPTYDDEAALMDDKTPLQMAQRYLENGAGEVVVKNGAVSAWGVSHHTQIECAALEVQDVVDATGAGDSFNGAYLAARLQGEGLEQALKAGHKLAATVIRHPGALIDKTVFQAVG